MRTTLKQAYTSVYVCLGELKEGASDEEFDRAWEVQSAANELFNAERYRTIPGFMRPDEHEPSIEVQMFELCDVDPEVEEHKGFMTWCIQVSSSKHLETDEVNALAAEVVKCYEGAARALANPPMSVRLSHCEEFGSYEVIQIREVGHGAVTVLPLDQVERGPDSSATEAGARSQADAHLRALLRHTEGFYGDAIAHGMKASKTANTVAHVERAAKGLHSLVHVWATTAESRKGGRL